MIIKSIKIEEKDIVKKFSFAENINLIYSDENSSGKTTLLRLILYSLGYQVPSTKKIIFEECKTILTIDCKIGECTIFRDTKFLITLKTNNEEEIFILPSEQKKLLKKIFGIDNENVINNLIGAFYTDQEKGWTLLNRGKVIGLLSFSIEELIRGLSDRNCEKLFIKRSLVSAELQKYKSMFNIAKYQAEINNIQGNIFFDSSNELIQKNIDALQLLRNPLKIELLRIKEVLKKNTSFKKYIESMKLYVFDSHKNKIPVNADTLIGYADNLNYLLTERTQIANEISKIDCKILEQKNKLQKENSLFDFGKENSLINSFDKTVQEFGIESMKVQKTINELEKQRTEINKSIKNESFFNNHIISEIHEIILQYAKELNLDEKLVSHKKDYIFTDDLKSLSGTIFHKIVFIFKLAYIKIIKDKTDINLPIILDSPSGREITADEVRGMLNILKRDFNEHQIIIASIHEYDILKPYKIISLKNRLMESGE